MTEATQNFRKKQALLVPLVFVCLVAAFLTDKASVAVGAILVACGICYLAARMQPEPPAEEHH